MPRPMARVEHRLRLRVRVHHRPVNHPRLGAVHGTHLRVVRRVRGRQSRQRLVRQVGVILLLERGHVRVRDQLQRRERPQVVHRRRVGIPWLRDQQQGLRHPVGTLADAPRLRHTSAPQRQRAPLRDEIVELAEVGERIAQVLERDEDHAADRVHRHAPMRRRRQREKCVVRRERDRRPRLQPPPVLHPAQRRIVHIQPREDLRRHPRIALAGGSETVETDVDHLACSHRSILDARHARPYRHHPRPTTANTSSNGSGSSKYGSDADSACCTVRGDATGTCPACADS